MKRIPLLPTLIVAIAVATMIGLGLWQVSRAHWKDALLVRYEQNRHLPAAIFPKSPTHADERLLFRRAIGECLQTISWSGRSGRNRAGDPGWRHIAMCHNSATRPDIAVDFGWSNSGTSPPDYRAGTVTGTIGPDRDHILLLVSDRPAPGLQASALPSFDDIPNNHRAYAIQWFFFAAVAALIYFLALRRRPAGGR